MFNVPFTNANFVGIVYRLSPLDLHKRGKSENGALCRTLAGDVCTAVDEMSRTRALAGTGSHLARALDSL